MRTEGAVEVGTGTGFKQPPLNQVLPTIASTKNLGCCVQTRMMAQKKSAFPDQYSGFVDCLLKVPRQEGFLALYKVTVSQTAFPLIKKPYRCL